MPTRRFALIALMAPALLGSGCVGQLGADSEGLDGAGPFGELVGDGPSTRLDDGEPARAVHDGIDWTPDLDVGDEPEDDTPVDDDGPIVAEDPCARAHPETVRVADGEELRRALAEARCGQQILLEDGWYRGRVAVDVDCPAEDPLLLRAETLLGARIDSEVRLAGAHVCVVGLDFQGPEATIRIEGEDHRVLGNRFRDFRGIAIGLRTGARAEIGYNELSDPHPWLPSEMDEDSDYPLRIGVRTIHDGVDDFHFDAWVHHNHFHDFPPKPDPDDYHSGQADALELCETATRGLSDGEHPTGWVIEHNLIERHMTGHGVIDLKCGGAIVRHNSLVDSPRGRIDCRNGPANQLVANWIEGAGGMTVHSAYHELVGNRLVDTSMGIAVMAGTAEWDFPANRLPDGGRALQRALDVHLSGNLSDRLVIGESYGDDYLLPALGTLVEAHHGRVSMELEEGTTIRETTTAVVPAARRLRPDEVGPGAMPF